MVRIIPVLTAGLVSVALSLEAIVIKREALTRIKENKVREVITEYVTERGTVRDIEFSAEIKTMGRYRRETSRFTEIRVFTPEGLVVYGIDHRTRTYVKTRVPPKLHLATLFFGILECDPKGENCRVSGNIRPTGEEERVGRWRAKKFTVPLPSGGPLRGGLQVLWFTKESGLLLESGRRELANLRRYPGLEHLLSAVERVLRKYGAVVKREVRIRGAERVERVREVFRAELKEERLRPPKGYRELKGIPAR
jgi:hypothetical protein